MQITHLAAVLLSLAPLAAGAPIPGIKIDARASSSPSGAVAVLEKRIVSPSESVQVERSAAVDWERAPRRLIAREKYNTRSADLELPRSPAGAVGAEDKRSADFELPRSPQSSVGVADKRSADFELPRSPQSSVGVADKRSADLELPRSPAESVGAANKRSADLELPSSPRSSVVNSDKRAAA